MDQNTQNPQARRLIWMTLISFQVILTFLPSLIFQDVGWEFDTAKLEGNLFVYVLTGFAFSALVLSNVIPRMFLQQMGPQVPPARQFSAWIIGMALKEFVGITGFIIAFLTEMPAAVLPFTGIAFATMIVSRPTEGHG